MMKQALGNGLAERVSLHPAVHGRQAVARQHRRAVVEAQPRPQGDRPHEPVRRHGMPLRHLRPRR